MFVLSDLVGAFLIATSTWLAGVTPDDQRPSSQGTDVMSQPEALSSSVEPATSLYVFGLVDVFRLHAQHRLEDRLGARFGANWGLPLVSGDCGLGFQIGGSASWADGGEQFFLTSGLFYRGDARMGTAWNAGAVIDWLDERNDEIRLFQVRGKTSLTLDPSSEIGFWGAASLSDDETDDFDAARTVDQANLFYRYLCGSGTDLTGWIGWRDRPDAVAIGGDLSCPITDSCAFTIGGHHGLSAEAWNLYTGVTRFFGGQARQRYLGEHRHLPYLSVADNTSMTLAIDQ